jgi:hypothetical protein
MKKCSKCKQEKSLNEYSKDSSRKDGISAICKPCRNILSNKWLNKNKEEYYAKRKGKYNEYYKNRYTNFTPEQRQKQREYLNKWGKENKDKVNGYKNKMRKNNPIFRLKESIRTRIYQFLKGKKDESMEYLLGCDIEFYKKYLEKQFTPEMNWGNYGTYWEIDHIKMLSTFNLENLVERKEAFTFTNTRPLPIKENRQRKN